MGQISSAPQVGQPGASPAPGGNKFSEDAFRHFKTDNGAWSRSNEGNQQNNDNNRSNLNDYNNSNPMTHNHMSSPNSYSNAGSGCFYTDVTSPNGPMDREKQMDRGGGGCMATRPNGPLAQPTGGRRGDSFASHNINHDPPAYSPPSPKHTAEMSTMMSTAFLQRNAVQEGVVQYKIDTVNEDGVMRYDNVAGGMMTYDEVPPQNAYGGMVTSDEPILGLPDFQHQKKNKAHPPPMQQAPCPVASHDMSSRDMSCSNATGFSQAFTSVSQRPAQGSPSTCAGTSVSQQPMNVVDELNERRLWDVGTVLEVFSASAGKFYIAQVAQVGSGVNAHMITVQFIGDNGQVMQKSMPRSDVQLAVFGRNTRQMPPGFQKVASESRPGQFSYQDSSSGTKYMTKELAWENYYNKIRESEQAQNMLKQQPLNGGAMAAPQTAAEQVAAERMKPAPLQPPPTMSLAPAPAVAKADVVLSSEFYAGAHGPDPVLAQSLQPAPTAASSQQYYSQSVQPAPIVDNRYMDNSSSPQYSYSVGAPVQASAQSQSLPHPAQHAVASSQESYSVGTPVQRAYSNIPTTVGDLRSTPMAPATEQRPQTMGNLSSAAQPQMKESFSGVGLPSSKKPFPGYGQSFAVGTNAGYEAYLASRGMA